MYKHLNPTFDKRIPHCSVEQERVWLGMRGAEREVVKEACEAYLTMYH